MQLKKEGQFWPFSQKDGAAANSRMGAGYRNRATVPGRYPIEARRKKRLEKEPEGFHLEEEKGPYNCRVCYQLIGGRDAWWDLNGVKCFDCQRNIKEGVIPAEICQNDDLWIKEWQLKSDYNLHPSTRGKLRREGILKGRDLKTEAGTIYYTVYLVSENKEFLKKYPKNPPVKVKFISPEKG